MPKKAPELQAIEVKRLDRPGLHAVGGVAGLHLQVLPSGARSWVLRVMVSGKRRDMGLGGYPDVPLAMAREKAREARKAVEKGIDPIAERRAARSALAAARGAEMTFDDAVLEYLRAKSGEWKNAKHAAQWTATLNAYASPVIGKVQVRDVELAHVMRILEPIWSAKTETATRLRGRIENVLDWATVRGYRKGENPARWRGHLDKLLAKPRKLAKVKHHAALPVESVGAFVRDLRLREGVAARALEVLILTAARSGEVRGMRWSEIDMQARIWIVPAERMKGGKEHRVPLNDRVLDILEAQPQIDGSDLVFPAPRGGQLSDMSLSSVCRRMKVDAVPHGFRSTFRDWCSEHTNYPREVAEMALAHTITNAVEAAYRRGDLFAKRRRLMDEWAAFVNTPAPKGEKVTPIRRKVQSNG